MKHIFAIICVISLCFCVSCKSQNNITAADLLGKAFSCNIAFSISGTEFTSDFIKTDEKAALTLTSPKTVEGFTFEKSDSTVTLSYNGIGLSVSEDKLPFEAASTNILSFYSEDLSQYSVEVREDGIYLSLDSSGITVYTVFDKETLVPLRTFDQNNSFEITYSDYQLL